MSDQDYNRNQGNDQFNQDDQDMNQSRDPNARDVSMGGRQSGGMGDQYGQQSGQQEYGQQSGQSSEYDQTGQERYGQGGMNQGGMDQGSMGMGSGGMGVGGMGQGGMPEPDRFDTTPGDAGSTNRERFSQGMQGQDENPHGGLGEKLGDMLGNMTGDHRNDLDNE